jgi:uncharacterized glyoxalase superfamily protein PhnB
MAKATGPIPTGFHTITLHLAVNGAAAYSDFLQRAFGAAEIERSPGPGGKLMHVQMKVGDSMLMFADDFSAEFGMPALAEGRLPFHIHIYLPDVDSVWEKAVAAGCQVEMPLGDQFWGDRYGQLKDPFGILWALATRKEELTQAERQERFQKAMSGQA